MTTLDELKTMMEREAATQAIARDRDAEWRGKFGSIVEKVVTEIQTLNRRVDGLERRDAEIDKRARKAMESSDDLEGRVMLELAAVNHLIKAGDHVRTVMGEKVDRLEAVNHAQMALITSSHEAIVGIRATVGFIKWLVPLAGATFVTFASALVWLMGHVK